MSVDRHDTVTFELKDLHHFPPELSSTFYKGKLGRIGIIGGSKEYTGAPYFAGITALRLGADLVHIFCCESAATAIKCYSPDLIVHPFLDDKNAIEQLKTWLPRLHAVVVGPGLGRADETMRNTIEILNLLKESGKLTIIDADGLFVVTKNFDLLYGFNNAIITPNKIEYERLVEAVAEKTGGSDDISQHFVDITIVKKGKEDKIFDSKDMCSAAGGGNRRCGGQGDILSGAIGIFSYWSELKNLEHKRLFGCYAACKFTKMLNELAFDDKGRTMVTSDMLQHITTGYNYCFQS